MYRNKSLEKLYVYSLILFLLLAVITFVLGYIEVVPCVAIYFSVWNMLTKEDSHGFAYWNRVLVDDKLSNKVVVDNRKYNLIFLVMTVIVFIIPINRYSFGSNISIEAFLYYLSLVLLVFYILYYYIETKQMKTITR